MPTDEQLYESWTRGILRKDYQKPIKKNIEKDVEDEIIIEYPLDTKDMEIRAKYKVVEKE